MLAAPLPESIADAIRRAYAELGPDVHVAVRSSATAEDLGAQRQALLGLGVAEDRIYLDHSRSSAWKASSRLSEAYNSASLPRPDTDDVTIIDE